MLFAMLFFDQMLLDLLASSAARRDSSAWRLAGHRCPSSRVNFQQNKILKPNQTTCLLCPACRKLFCLWQRPIGPMPDEKQMVAACREL
jgi:hypothetical protein